MASLIFENYLSAQYLFIPALLLLSLLFFPKQVKRYKKSLFVVLLLFILLFLLLLRTATSLEAFFSFPHRLHIFASFILYLLVAFSLFLLHQKNKKISLAIFATLLLLFLVHSPPVLAKKLISVSESLSSLHLVETKSIVCSKDYYLPLTVHTFINAFLFCFPHHPVYYDDATDWREPIKTIENARRKEATTTFIFSSYAPISSFYFDKAMAIRKQNVYKGGALYKGEIVYKGDKSYQGSAIYSLQCSSSLPFCSDDEKLDVLLEFADIENRRNKGEILDVFFIIDAGRYDWILQKEQKEFLENRCSQYESDFFLYKC